MVVNLLTGSFYVRFGIAVAGNIHTELFIQKAKPCPIAQNANKYIAVRDGLYKDDKGNLYFKTIDWSHEDFPVDRYIFVVYSQRFGANGIKEMKYVIDPTPFIQ